MSAPPNALIFGASGQDAHYLRTLLEGRGVRVDAVSRSSGPWLAGDVSQWETVAALVKEHQPAFIIHLAANSTTRHDALFENHATISGGALNVCEAARLHAPDARVFLAGSGLQFRNAGKPISERDEFHAGSPYAAARIHSVYAARYYRGLGLRVYIGYLFHHESPLRKPHHVAKMIALAAAGRKTLEIGDVSVEKEWAFAGDIAEGILTLISQDAVFEACIGSGVAYSIQDWIEACFAVIGKDWRGYVRQREGFKPEYARLVSDPSLMHSLGWRAKTGLRELAEMMVG